MSLQINDIQEIFNTRPRPTSLYMTLHTRLAGGSAHGRDLMHVEGHRCEVNGTGYRFYSGPYQQADVSGRAYQIFVAENLDDAAAQQAVLTLLRELRS